MKLDKFSWDWFGQARVVTVGKEETTIVDGKGDTDKIKQRIEELQAQIDKSTSPYEKEKLQERLAKFIGGVAVVHVGGFTEAEMREKKDRVDDALQATKAALEEGIVPGGGSVLLHARTNINVEDIGSQIVYNACAAPFKKILANAGYEQEDIYNAINAVTGGDYWYGWVWKHDGNDVN
jgi:chaperonin GroEL